MSYNQLYFKSSIYHIQLKNIFLLNTKIKFCLFLFFILIISFSQSGFSQTANTQTATKSYTFTLSTSATVSAGVYSGDILIRTLFNTSKYSAGTYTLSWDGKDDDGNIMSGDNYNVKILSHNITFTWEGVIGACNNSDSLTGPSVWRHFSPISDMVAINYKGINYMDVGIPFSEAEPAQYRFDITHPRTCISYRPRGTGQVTILKCANSNYIFNAGRDYCGANNFVFATDMAGNDVTFTNVKTEIPCNGLNYNNALDLNSLSTTGVQLGMACTNKYLYISRQDSIVAYRIDNGSASRVLSLQMTGATKMVNEGQNILWVCYPTTVKRYNINSDGSLTSPTLIISGFDRPAAIDVLAGDLCVFDAGNQQIVKRFNSSTGVATNIIGTVGGYAISPAITNTKFYIEDVRQGVLPTYVRHQADGTIWIGDTGNKRNMHFAANGTYIDNITWLPATYFCTSSINQPNRIFAEFLEYSIDYTQPIASRATLLNNWGFKFPATVNGHATTIGQGMFSGIGLFSNGHRYGIGNIGSYGSFMFELASNGFKAIEGPYVPQFSQIGEDLSLENGTVKYAQAGYNNTTDGQSYPAYNFTPISVPSPNPGTIYPINSQRKIFTTANGNQVIWDGNNDNQKYALAAYNPSAPTIFKWKRLPSTIANYAGDFPDNSFDKYNSVIYSGGPVGTAGSFIIAAYRGENWKQGQTSKFFITHQDGLAIGTPGVVQAEIPNSAQPAFGYSTNILSIITHEDSVNHKVYWIINGENGHSLQSWVMSNTNSVNIQTIPLVPIATTALISATPGVDLLTGTPESTTFTGAPGWTRFPQVDDSSITTFTRNKQNDMSTPPDIGVNVNGYAQGGAINYFLRRDIPYNSAQPDWKITGKLILNQFFSGSEAPSHEKTYITINDNLGKVIFRADFYQTARMSINGVFYQITGTRLPASDFEISKSGSTVFWSFTISGIVYSGNASMFDTTANINSPSNINFIWGFAGWPSNGFLDIIALKYYDKKADQFISFDNIMPKKYGDQPFTLISTSSANLPVQYTVVSGPARVSGNTLTITGTGKVIIRAGQDGNSLYNPASSVIQTFTVLSSRIDL